MSEIERTRRTLKPPTYRLHKASGQARVRLNGDEIYLGKFGTDESRQEYARLIAEYSSWAVLDRGKKANPSTGLSVAKNVLAYVKHAQNTTSRTVNRLTRSHTSDRPSTSW